MKSSRTLAWILLGCMALGSCGLKSARTTDKQTSTNEDPTDDSADPESDAQTSLEDSETTVQDPDEPAGPSGIMAPLKDEYTRTLFVADDDSGDIQLYDVKDHHKGVGQISLPGKLSRFRGITCHPKSAMIYLTDSSANVVLSVNLMTRKVGWNKSYSGKDACGNPDRLNVTGDGKALYVPCKDDNRYLILDTSDGHVIKNFDFPNAPHNTFAGEGGHTMYLTGYRNKTLEMWNTDTHTKISEIGPFSGGIRPFSVTRDEKLAYVNLTPLLGFGVADLSRKKVAGEYEQKTPSDRTSNKSAQLKASHGGDPRSHGMAVRPGGKEIWFIDDDWGYLYVYDITTQPPRHKADVPMFSDIKKAWGDDHNRWVMFSIDGKYVYPSDGSIFDADTHTMLSEHVAKSEKQLEVVFSDGKPILCSGQNGGWYQ